MKKILLILIISLLFVPNIVYGETITNYIIKDIDSGRIFSSKADNIRKLPASTTKIMTLVVAIENSNMDDVVEVKDEILQVDGSNIYLEIGEHILMQDLIYGMILRSGNDAAMTIARSIGGSINNFNELMNEKARELKLLNTHFNNPTGLDDYEKNYTTLNELTEIYRYGYKYKDFREILKTKKYISQSDKKSYLFNNRSKLLFMYDKCTGAKTGYTPDAGRILISSASNNDLNLVIATIGNDYGYNFHINNYEKIFNSYKRYKLLDKDKRIINKNFKESLYIKRSFFYPLTKKEYEKSTNKLVLNGKKTGYIGDIYIYLDNDIIHKEKVYLKENKTSIIDKIKSLFT